MAHVTSAFYLSAALVGGWTFLQVPGAFDGTLGPAARAPATSGIAADGAAATEVNRFRKTDRLQLRVSSGQLRHLVARIEIGQSKAMVFRDASGAVLFGTDPAARITTIAKDVVLPEITLPGNPAVGSNDTPASAASARSDVPSPDAQRAPVIEKAPQQISKRPAGCDPAFSPIAAPQLGHIVGRCITSVAPQTKVARAE